MAGLFLYGIHPTWRSFCLGKQGSFGHGLDMLRKLRPDNYNFSRVGGQVLRVNPALAFGVKPTSDVTQVFALGLSFLEHRYTQPKVAGSSRVGGRFP